MRRFIITSPKFTGTIEVHYSDAGIITLIRFISCDLAPAHLQKFIIIISTCILIDDLPNQLRGYPHLTIVEADFEVSLSDFKREYPYSRNYHLLDAIWSKMNKSDQVQAYFAAIEYRKYCERNGIKPPYIKIAASWINTKEYKNDWRKL